MDTDRGTTLPAAKATRTAVAAFAATAAGTAVDTCGTGTTAATTAAAAAGPAVTAKATYRLRIFALRRQRTATIAAAAARPAGTIIATPTGTGVSALRVQAQEAGRSAIDDHRARASSTAAAVFAGFERRRTRVTTPAAVPATARRGTPGTARLVVADTGISAGYTVATDARGAAGEICCRGTVTERHRVVAN